MLQYIINLTATWLLSLLVFELFLKKETYHTYNRIYLLSTFLIGIFLPLWSWTADGAIISNSAVQPVIKLAVVRESISTAATRTNFALSWQEYLWYIYLAGAIVSFVLLVYELSKIIVLYQIGNKSKQGKWTVVETVKGHAPFSIFHILFVDTKEQYSAEQWKIILDHEEQHSRLWHFADQLLMQIARIVFWFHPLVYIYNSRIMLLHEYQADKISGRQPSVYGKFLVEQALLHTAPALSHSFNRSPIKTRIVMLTKNSSLMSKTKILLSIPLIFICALCFSKNQYSNKMEKNGNFVTYRGNKFELSLISPPDTIMVIDPVTGKEAMKIARIMPYPIKMNGEKIYNNDDLQGKKNEMGQPSNNSAGFNGDNIREYLITKLSDALKDLPNGEYIIDLTNVVINKEGKIVYFEYGGVKSHKEPFVTEPKIEDIDKRMQDKLTDKVYDILNNAPAHSPGTYDGSDVSFLIRGDSHFWNPFTIKDHKLVKL